MMWAQYRWGGDAEGRVIARGTREECLVAAARALRTTVEDLARWRLEVTGCELYVVDDHYSEVRLFAEEAR